MKKLFAIAAFLLASTAAQAQYTFEYGGRTIRIDPDRGTVRSRASMTILGGGQNARTATRTTSTRRLSRRRSIARAGCGTCAGRHRRRARQCFARSVECHGGRRARGYRGSGTACGQRACPASSAGRRRSRYAHPCRPAGAARSRRNDDAGAQAPRCCGSGGQFAARRVADRGEGRQGEDRAMRRQSLRLFRGQEIEPERRAGPDQHEARQGFQMERPHPRPQYRQHLYSTIALKGSDTLRVQGCAFGGMFCGGQTWSRVN